MLQTNGGFDAIWDDNLSETEVTVLAKQTILEKTEGADNVNLKIGEVIF